MYSESFLSLSWEGRGADEERGSFGPGLSSTNASDLPPHASEEDPVASSSQGGSPSPLPDGATPPEGSWSSVVAKIMPPVP